MKDSQIKIRPKSGRDIYIQGEDAFELYLNLKEIFKEDDTGNYSPKVGDKVICRSGITMSGGDPWEIVAVDELQKMVTVDPKGNGLKLVWVADFEKFNKTFIKAI